MWWCEDRDGDGIMVVRGDGLVMTGAYLLGFSGLFGVGHQIVSDTKRMEKENIGKREVKQGPAAQRPQAAGNS